VGFNEETDRLFMAGDGPDRGPHSEEYVMYLAKPWFFAIMGNHEYMPIAVYNGLYSAESVASYVKHGGEWFVKLPRDVQKLYVELFSALPYGFEIETPHGLVGVVHAEPFESWALTTEAIEDFDTFAPAVQQAILQQLLWCRDRSDAYLHLKKRGWPWTPYPIEDIWRVYVGHSPQQDVLVLDNIHYIDTAVVFGNKLTLVNLTQNTLVQVPAERVYWERKK
jgi:serine/threonine protein phosphatase 1